MPAGKPSGETEAQYFVCASCLVPRGMTDDEVTQTTRCACSICGETTKCLNARFRLQDSDDGIESYMGYLKARREALNIIGDPGGSFPGGGGST